MTLVLRSERDLGIRSRLDLPLRKHRVDEQGLIENKPDGWEVFTYEGEKVRDLEQTTLLPTALFLIAAVLPEEWLSRVINEHQANGILQPFGGAEGSPLMTFAFASHVA